MKKAKTDVRTKGTVGQISQNQVHIMRTARDKVYNKTEDTFANDGSS